MDITNQYDRRMKRIDIYQQLDEYGKIINKYQRKKYMLYNKESDQIVNCSYYVIFRS